MTTSIFKKDGQLTAMHQEAVSKILHNKRVYPRTWTGSGRRKSLRNISAYVMDVANFYGYKVKTGNDAPRGGQEGRYIEFSTRAQNALSAKFGKK
jgi:hypothetical protein